MLQIAGRCWIAIALIHGIFGLVVYYPQWQAIAQAGWFNVVAPDPFAPIFDRENAFWFMFITPFFFLIGQLSLWVASKKLVFPVSVGAILLGTVIVGVFLMPVSGIWLGLPPSIMFLWTSKQNRIVN
jgi:hypothetical protein